MITLGHSAVTVLDFWQRNYLTISCVFVKLQANDNRWPKHCVLFEVRRCNAKNSFVISTGYIMLAKSTGRCGDQITLTSTIHNYSEPTILRFSYYIQQVDASAGGTLFVYLLSIQRAPVKEMFTSESQPSNEWRDHELCIPAGTYYVQFLARLGLPFKSDVGLDDVQLTHRRCIVHETASSTGNVNALM